MKRLSIVIPLLLFSLCSMADHGSWRLYLSYSGEPQDIESADKFIYVQVNNGLYSYCRSDHSIYTFSRLNLLSDIEVEHIAWAKAVRKLVVVYKNGNIDLITKDGTVCENISSYYTKNVTVDKTINDIAVCGSNLLLATNFGVVNIDLVKAEILETYRLNVAVRKAVMDDRFVYALSANGSTLYKGDRSKNMLDPNVWTQEEFSNQVSFTTENDVVKEEDRAVVATLRLDDAPRNNIITSLRFDNDRLLVAAGGRRSGIDDVKNAKKAYVSEYTPGQGWRHYDDFQSAATNLPYSCPVSDIIVNPYDKEHVFFATLGNGLYEYRNGKQLYNYTACNTEAIKSAVSSGEIDSYVLVKTGVFMSADEFLFINSYNYNPVIKLNLKDKTFKSWFFSELLRDERRSHASMVGLMRDSRGLYWFGNDNYTHAALYSLDMVSGHIQEYNTFVNQDGTLIDGVYGVRCVMEDLENNLWVATDRGPLLLTPELMESPKSGFIQVKVPRNDGSSYADYLLTGIDITCMALDGAGRKWFGTGNNGIYVISADNMEQVEHFTTKNSLLLSDEIISLAINQKSGEVFIGTYNGLCSYMSDATQPNDEMTKDNVWAYPNPVRPDYQGYITIVGLSFNSRVTITTSSGHIVASGTSTGGSFKWDGCDSNGKRVASGVYMVHTATSSGESGVVCKVAVIN